MRAIHTLTPLLLACSCAPDAGEARFEVTQVALQQDCMRRAFPFEPTDLRAQRHPGSTSLFFQNNPGPARSADLLTIELFADNPAAQPLPILVERNPSPQPGEPALAARVPNDTPAARADLQLLNTCPLLDDSLLIEGSVTITEFGRDPGDTIAGQLTAKLLDARTGATVAESLTGTFSFTIDHGRTSENLYDARREAAQ